MDTEEVEKSLIVKVKKDVWRRFKSKLDMEDKKIGPIVKRWILAYIDPPKNETPKVPDPETPVKADKAVVSRKRPRREDVEPEMEKAVVSRPDKQARESLEIATNKDEPEAEKELPTLDEAGINFKDVKKFAKHLAIDVKGKTQEEAAFAVLDAIVQDYGNRCNELSDDDFNDYKTANIGMLDWYNKFKIYGTTDEEDEPQFPEGGVENEEETP